MAGSRESGLAAIKEKISAFGADLKACGATKINPKWRQSNSYKIGLIV